MSTQSFSAGDPYLTTGSYTATSDSTGDYWYTDSTIYNPNIVFVDPNTLKISAPAFEVDGGIKIGGKNMNKLDWDLSRFTLARRLRFLFNLLFKGKAIMEVEPKQIKLEKALETLKNAK